VTAPGTLDPRVIAGLQSLPDGARVLENAVQAFLRDASEAMPRLSAACATGDRDTVRRLAHTLAGNSAMLGATHLADLLREVERDAPSAPLKRLSRRLTAVQDESAAVETALRALEPLPAGTPWPAPDRAPVVLIVDDEPTSRLVLAASLRVDGFTVEEVADGFAALARMETLRPDLVVLDVVMPEMDGFETCCRIRGLPHSGMTPVLMVTGLDDPGVLARAFEVGATDFVTKPITPALLTHRVRFLLRMSAALEEARRSEARLAEAQRIARVGNWDWHVATGVFRGSAEAARLLGLGAAATEVPIERLYERIVPEEREQLRQALAAVAAEHATLNCEHRVAADGEPGRCVHLLGEAVRDAGGAVRVAGTAQDVTQRVEAQSRIQRLAYHDALTGLPNRRHFSDQLHRMLSAARRKDRRAAVMLVDLDEFKRINDTLGHSVGDQVLVEVAGRLGEVVRASDAVGREELGLTGPHAVARLGGDEFLIAVADLGSGEDAAVVAGRLLKALAAPFRIGDHELFVSASIGISVFPDDGEDLEALLKHADLALYQAKDAGRNTGEFFNPSMNAAALQRLLLETNLRRAVERDEIVVHFQPLLNARTGRLIGVEALLRWTHPDLGPVAPLQFVQVAERIGLIGALTDLVLRRTCEHLVRWRAAGFDGLRASVNVSPVLLRRPDIIPFLTAAPAAAGIDPAHLELEITEGALMEKPHEAERMLAELRRRGFRIALDDFGTGYSSLGYLRRFPLDTLKIDRSFVRDIAENDDDAAIVTAVVSLARGLGIEPLAEGIETEEQRDALLDRGCDLMQGHLFGRPMPAPELEQFLTRASVR
jgi:diguanylate cyclase (GGDEF)-like protein